MFGASVSEGQARSVGRRDKAQELVSAFGWAVPWGILLDVVGCCCTVVSALTETPTLMAAHEGAGSGPTCLSVLSPEALANLSSEPRENT